MTVSQQTEPTLPPTITPSLAQVCKTNLFDAYFLEMVNFTASWSEK